MTDQNSEIQPPAESSLKLNREVMDVLVANVIPTSKYFESRFDHMQHQINDVKENIRDFKTDVDKRFDQTQHQINDVKEGIRDFKTDVDRRLEQIVASIDKLGDKLDNRDRDQRGFTMRMFTIAISISILGAIGVFLKALGII